MTEPMLDFLRQVYLKFCLIDKNCDTRDSAHLLFFKLSTSTILLTDYSDEAFTYLQQQARAVHYRTPHRTTPAPHPIRDLAPLPGLDSQDP
jgi:hypothetical protein